MSEVKAGERYRHFKGEEYVIVAIGLDSDSLKKVVVYQGDYTLSGHKNLLAGNSEEFGKNPVWVRGFEDFCGYKVYEDGRKIKRFERIEDED